MSSIEAPHRQATIPPSFVPDGSRKFLELFVQAVSFFPCYDLSPCHSVRYCVRSGCSLPQPFFSPTPAYTFPGLFMCLVPVLHRLPDFLVEVYLKFAPFSSSKQALLAPSFFVFPVTFPPPRVLPWATFPPSGGRFKSQSTNLPHWTKPLKNVVPIFRPCLLFFGYPWWPGFPVFPFPPPLSFFF